MKILLRCVECVQKKKGCTAQKMKFSIKGFFSKCDQIRRKLRIWLHLLKKFLMENFIFCAVMTESMTELNGVFLLTFVVVFTEEEHLPELN